MHSLQHKHITKILGQGVNGYIIKKSGRKIENLHYIILEYVPGGDLFDTIKELNGLGEQGARFFMV